MTPPHRPLSTLLAVTLLGSLASGQLLAGYAGSFSGSDPSWNIDPSTGSRTMVWPDFSAQAMAADDANGLLYVGAFDGLHVWPYGSPDPPVLIGPLVSATTGFKFNPRGFAFAEGRLFMTIPGEVTEVDLATGVFTTLHTFPSPGSNYGGLAYDPTDGMFYATCDFLENFAGIGIYRVDVLGSGLETFVAPYPPGEDDVDGLAIGDGRAYLITDAPGGEHHVYDFALGAYVQGIPNLLQTQALQGTGAWAPGLAPGGGSTYCTGKANSLGCTPEIFSNGTPSMTAAVPFHVSVGPVLNNKPGLLFYGTASAALPFQGGLLCVQAPIRRTTPQSSGGSPPPNNCSGTFVFDFNAYVQGGADPAIMAGTTLYGQYWSRDPQSPSTTSLSNGLTWTMGS